MIEAVCAYVENAATYSQMRLDLCACVKFFSKMLNYKIFAGEKKNPGLFSWASTGFPEARSRAWQSGVPGQCKDRGATATCGLGSCRRGAQALSCSSVGRSSQTLVAAAPGGSGWPQGERSWGWEVTGTRG